jgi:hypothetical protein
MAISHRLTQEEATKRIKTLLGEVKVQFADKISNLQEKWNGSTGEFSFSAMGFSVSGVLTVRPSGVELEGKIPLMALPFKGTIESILLERAEKLLA